VISKYTGQGGKEEHRRVEIRKLNFGNGGASNDLIFVGKDRAILKKG